MKTKYLFGLLIILMSGCTSRTEYGRCIGLNGKEDPKLQYEWSTRNIVVGSIFVEMIFPPIVVLVKETKCPIGRNP